jgi:hypothetical protein
MPRRIWVGRGVALFIVVVGLFNLVSTRAESTAAFTVDVMNNSAAPDFPNVVTFDLEAAADHELKRMQLFYSLADDEKLYLAEPEFSPGTKVNLSYELDLGSKGIPPGMEITYQWRFKSSEGAAIETEPKSFVWIDDRFDWSSVSSDQVTVHTYNDDESFNNEILDSAQRTIDKLQSEFGLDPISPVDIWAYDSNQDFEGARLANTETWSAAITYPEYNLVVAVLPDGNHSEIGRIVPHEISHQVLHQATKNPFNYPPTWLDEGLAVMNQDTGNEDMDEIVLDAAADGRLLSIRSLNTTFPYDPTEVDLAYAEGFSVVTFIIDRYGPEKMGALIDAYREGLSHDDAARAALGVDLDELDRLWRESLG